MRHIFLKICVTNSVVSCRNPTIQIIPLLVPSLEITSLYIDKRLSRASENTENKINSVLECLQLRGQSIGKVLPYWLPFERVVQRGLDI